MNQIRKARRRMAFTQAQLAERIGSSRETVNKWERGKTEPSAHLLRKVSAVLGVSVGYLLDEDPPGAPQRVSI